MIDASHIHAWKTLSSVERQRRTPKSSIMSTRSVPEHLRNESCVENKSSGKRRRKDMANDNIMKIFEVLEYHKESRKERKELTTQLFAGIDTILAKLPNVNVDIDVDEGEVLFKEHHRIVDQENHITSNTSMDTDTKAKFLKALKFRKEAMETKLDAYIAKNEKRKASELSDTSS